MRKLLVLGFLLSKLSLAFGGFELANFSLGISSFTPSDWKSSTFLDAAWTPHWDLGFFTPRLGFGVSALKNGNDQRVFTSFYQAALMVPLVSIIGVEASFGYRSLHEGTLGSHPEWGFGLLVRPGEFVDRVYVCMSRFLLPENTISIFRVGVALSF